MDLLTFTNEYNFGKRELEIKYIICTETKFQQKIKLAVHKNIKMFPLECT